VKPVSEAGVGRYPNEPRDAQIGGSPFSILIAIAWQPDALGADHEQKQDSAASLKEGPQLC
jgi:hypothetical protein